jgi:hypothetical protein
MSNIIKLNINVTKLDKTRFYKGKTGTYANLTVLLRDETDQYGNDGMIVEDVSQEERQSGTKGAIVGNARIAGQKPKAQSAPAPSSAADDDSDIPF